MAVEIAAAVVNRELAVPVREDVESLLLDWLSDSDSDRSLKRDAIVEIVRETRVGIEGR